MGFLFAGAVSSADTLVGPETSMRFRVNRSDPGNDLSWIRPGHDDASWADGRLPVGFETGTPVGARVLIRTPADPPAASIYSRVRFTIDDPSSIESLYLGVDYDDGFVAWVNGVEVARSESMPGGPPAWNTQAGSHESSNGSLPRFHPRHDISATGMQALRSGENLLAIGVWNSEPDSSDLVLAAELRANQPLGTFVTRGPYLQLGTENAVTVRWRTDRPTDSRVIYGSKPGALTNSVTDPRPKTDHRLRLTGLEPGTLVHYAVGSSTTVLVGDDAQHVFRVTADRDSPLPLRIWVTGDAGTAGGIPGQVRDGYRRFANGREADLWITVGDNAYHGGNDERYQAALFETYPRILRRTVLWSTPGNHDHDVPGGFYDVFELPTRGEAGGVASGTETYYSFDHGNVHFFALDTEQVQLVKEGPMLQWLERDLRTTDAEWVVGFWHRAPYSSGLHDSDRDAGSIFIRRHVLPLIEAHGVDLVFSGHAHRCQRTTLLTGHYGAASSLDPEMLLDPAQGRPDDGGPYRKSLPRRASDGVVYAVVGCSGEATENAPSHPAMTESMNRPGSLVLDVDGRRLDARFIDTEGRVRDRFAIVKSE
jgi:hypothetical protein